MLSFRAEVDDSDPVVRAPPLQIVCQGLEVDRSYVCTPGTPSNRPPSPQLHPTGIRRNGSFPIGAESCKKERYVEDRIYKHCDT